MRIENVKFLFMNLLVIKIFLIFLYVSYMHNFDKIWFKIHKYF